MFARAAVTEYHTLGLNNRNLLSHSLVSGSLRSGVRGLVLSEALQENLVWPLLTSGALSAILGVAWL